MKQDAFKISTNTLTPIQKLGYKQVSTKIDNIELKNQSPSSSYGSD